MGYQNYFWEPQRFFRGFQEVLEEFLGVPGALESLRGSSWTPRGSRGSQGHFWEFGDVLRWYQGISGVIQEDPRYIQDISGGLKEVASRGLRGGLGCLRGFRRSQELFKRSQWYFGGIWDPMGYQKHSKGFQGSSRGFKGA